MSRMSRKEIKRDELVTTLESLTVAAGHHVRSLAIAAVAVAVLIAAVSGGVWYSRSQARAAALGFGEIQRAVDAPVVAGGAAAPGVLSFATPQARAEEVLRRAEALVGSHPSSRQAPWAAYWKAIALKDLGRHDDALAALAPLASQDEPFLSAAARVQQAEVTAAKGNLSGAAEMYAGLAASPPARFPVEVALMGQARMLEAQGKGDEAKAIYRRVTQEYPESPYAAVAGQRVNPPASS